jgi:sulfite reductase alpha subunit-like flavoprotein
LIYVCGNLGMANSFVDTIKKIIAEIKNWTEVEAEREYNEFVKNRRINVEAWG